jgi:hypothetical protein
MLMNAVRRVALLLSDKSNSITLSFGKDKLEVIRAPRPMWARPRSRSR